MLSPVPTAAGHHKSQDKRRTSVKCNPAEVWRWPSILQARPDQAGQAYCWGLALMRPAYCRSLTETGRTAERAELLHDGALAWGEADLQRGPEPRSHLDGSTRKSATRHAVGVADGAAWARHGTARHGTADILGPWSRQSRAAGGSDGGEQEKLALHLASCMTPVARRK